MTPTFSRNIYDLPAKRHGCNKKVVMLPFFGSSFLLAGKDGFKKSKNSFVNRKLSQFSNHPVKPENLVVVDYTGPHPL
jgi:hypothetical protein